MNHLKTGFSVTIIRFFSGISVFVAAAFIFLLLVPGVGKCDGPRIAVLPWKVNAAGDMGYVKNAMSDMLVSRLGSGKAEIVRPDQVGEVASGKGELNDHGALSAGKALKADYALYGSLTIFGNAVSLDARLVNINTGEAAPFASKGTGIESVIGLADKLSTDVISFLNPKAEALPAAVEVKPVSPAPVAASAAPAPAPAGGGGFIVKADSSKEQPVLWKGRDMDGMYLAMAAADLDKDGAKELFLISERSVTIARYNAKGMEVIKEIKDKQAQNVAVTSIDSDNDGASEVYVSRVSDGKSKGMLIEYLNGEYVVTASNLGWMMRAVDINGKGPVFLGQRFRSIDGFYGDLKRLRKDGGALKEEGSFEIGLPRKVNIFNFESFIFTGAKAPDLVTLDERQYLTLYAAKEKGWDQGFKSADYYGGTLNLVKPKDAGADSKPVFIEGRYFQADLNKDGKKELIIKKNTPGGLGRSAEVPSSFKTGEIISLSWDVAGGAAFENWRTKQVGGYIADFFIDDLDADGNQEITMLVVTGTEKLFGTLKSYILSYRISL